MGPAEYGAAPPSPRPSSSSIVLRPLRSSYAMFGPRKPDTKKAQDELKQVASSARKIVVAFFSDEGRNGASCTLHALTHGSSCCAALRMNLQLFGALVAVVRFAPYFLAGLQRASS